MNKASAKLISTLFLTFLLVFVFGVENARAQQSGDQQIDDTFQVSPLRYDWSAALSEEKKGMIFVKNNSTEPIDIELEVQDFSVNQDIENNTNFFVPNENHALKAYDVINWIDIDKTPFRLDAGQSKQINFSANIPEKTPTGGYYGVIFFTKKPINEIKSDAPVQVDVLYRLGVLVTFGVKGKEPIIEKGELKLFKPTKKVFIDNPVSFDIQTANTGNFPYKVSGFVDIYRFGKKISTLDVAPKLLYPDRTRGISDISWNFSFFAIGKYDAKLHLVSEDGAVVFNGNTSLVIIPWKLVAITFLILVVLWIIFYAGSIRGKKKIEQK